MKYYGIKCVDAWPETRGDGETDPIADGYGIQYEDGYKSWSPKDVFDKAYQPINQLGYPAALHAILNAGRHGAREGWNGKGMFIFLVDNAPGLAPFIAINTGNEVRPWTASQQDMLATDWIVSQ